MNRTFIIMVVFGMLLVSFMVAPTEKAYADVSGIPDKYEEQINYLFDKGIIHGYPDGTFRGDDEVSRQQAATMIGRALGLDNTKRTTDFPDVDRDSYASGYIQSAKDAGIISGYPDGTFKPHKTVTRGEMAYLVTKAFGLDKLGGITFTDVTGPDSLVKAVNRLATAGVTIGYPDGTYRPDAKITRTQYSLFMARALNNDYRVDNEEELENIGERIVTGDPLNVRSGPGTGYEVISKFSAGTTVTVHAESGSWLQVSHGNVTGYIHSYYTTSAVESSRVIAIDAGHGGYDPGAVANGVREKDVNLDVSKRVRNYLRNAGIEVVMPRDNDTYISLSGRVDYAERKNADTFVSIHSNYHSNSSANGVETYYSSAALGPRAYKSYRLSGFIQDRLVEAMDSSDRGVKEAGFHVIKRTTLPSALIELGFLSNKTEAEKLDSSYWRDRAAKAISRGVIDYYHWLDNR
ncbi:N-acetylmuramoyl-L-alanine amidase [Salimicrobium sp. PL1-032A]|uniref:N-acetylmuramoyl-L-alanine amidase n=1 Tax=Salimicrobium sp. PL1-032A TaxID=3095364 RepID=UPI00325FFC2F